MPSVEFAEIETARAKAWEIRAYEREAQRDEALARVDQLAEALANVEVHNEYVDGKWWTACDVCDTEARSSLNLPDIRHPHAHDCVYLWAIEHVTTISGDAA